MANEKSKAEQYRDERKARIAKAAKKNAKGMEKRNAAKKVVGKVISIILVVAIALGVVNAFLSTFGVQDRMIIIGSVGEEKVKFTAAEYEYYYYSMYNSLVNQISQEKSYYGSSSYTYDTSLPIDQQTTKYTDSTTKEEKTWEQFIHDQTVERIKAIKLCYTKALKAGYKLDDADKASIDEQINSLNEQAKQMAERGGKEYSLNAYIRFSMGPYNERFLRKMMEQQMLASKYQKEQLEAKHDSYKQDEIDKVYNEDKTVYDFVDICIYQFSNEKVEEIKDEKEADTKKRQEKADAQTKKDANDFFAAVTDEASFYAQATAANKDDKTYNAKSQTMRKMVLKSDLSSLSDDATKWIFNTKTKAGEKKMFTDEKQGTYTIVLLLKPMYQAKTVSVRHILFNTIDLSSGEALSAEEIKKAKQNAEDALKKWKDGDKTEDSFAALATELTADEGSKSTGGLYEDFRFPRMVFEFSDWSYDPARKAGDVEIVETEYGYHVMYFIGEAKSDYYDDAIRDEKAQQDVSKDLEKLVDEAAINFNMKSFGMRQSRKKVIKKLNTLLQLTGSNSSSSYSY